MFASGLQGATGIAGTRMRVVALSVAVAVACVPPVLAEGKAKPVAEVQVRAPDGPLMVVVSIGSQRMRVFDRHGAVIESPISTGRDEYDTPQGVFAIIERNNEHFSNLYDDAPMPNMQRITWSGVALHAGHVPGYRASHGCIRLPEKVSEKLIRPCASRHARGGGGARRRAGADHPPATVLATAGGGRGDGRRRQRRCRPQFLPARW